MIRSVLLMCLICFVGGVTAQSKKTTVSPNVFKQLSKSNELIEKKKYVAARETLKIALSKSKKNSFEQAAVLRALSSVNALQSAYVKAAQQLAQAVNLNVFPDDQQQQAILNLGQLYLASEQYRQAIATLVPWLAKNASPDPELSVLLANAYAQTKQYSQALPHIKRAIASKRKPPEAWLQLNLALLYELKRYRSAAQLLERLIKRFPDNKDYWEQLSSVYVQSKQYKKAAGVKHLALQKGVLHREKDILSVVDLYGFVGAPFKAADIMQSALKAGSVKRHASNWEKLANVWLQAREYDKAINALAKASLLHSRGELFLRLGQIHIELEQWDKAISALQQALQKGGLKQPGQAHLLIGVSSYELNRKQQAMQAFRSASQFNRQKKSAQQWLSYLASE